MDKLVSKQKVYSPKISLLYSPFSKRKKAPIWEFFLRTKTFGHNTFCIALHVTKIDNFNLLNYKITDKIHKFSLMDNNNRQLPWNKGISSTHRKSKKKLSYGSFFSPFLCIEKILIYQGIWRYCVSTWLHKLFLLVNLQLIT